MKAYQIVVAREVFEFVTLTVPGNSAKEALDHLEAIGLDQGIEDYAEKDIDGDYPAWEFGDYTGDVHIDEYSANKEVWQCDQCGEIREMEEIKNHIAVCARFLEPQADK